jgi:hypothetical protein
MKWLIRSLDVLGGDLMVLGLLPNADQERYGMLGEDLMVFGLLRIADQQRK